MTGTDNSSYSPAAGTPTAKIRSRAGIASANDLSAVSAAAEKTGDGFAKAR